MQAENPHIDQLLLHAMALVVFADAEGRETELTAVFEAYERMCGQPLDPAMLREVVSRVETDIASAWSWFSYYSQGLDEGEKAAIVKAAVSVSIADAELQDEELRTLTRLARTLDVPGADLRKWMNEVWDESRC